MITEAEIEAMRPAAQTIAYRRREVAQKVLRLMIDNMALNHNDTEKCGGVYHVHDEVAVTDRNYHTREGVRKAVAAVAPELLSYATAFPQYAVKTAEALPPRTQQRAVAQGGGDE